MSDQNISISKKEAYAILTVNRPKQLNALNKATIAELSAALQTLGRDATVRAIILTGAGEKAFVAGADIKEFADFGIQEGTELAAVGQEQLFDSIDHFSKPVIAAVNGFALGGGLELAMSCHMRIAADTARLGLPEVTLGLIPGYGGTQRLAQLVGKGRALEMITSAQMINAQRAFEMGLVNEVCPADELLPRAEKLASVLARNSPQAIESAIKAVNAGFRSGVNGYKVEMEEFGKCFGTPDFKEGVEAFLAKRKPNFS